MEYFEMKILVNDSIYKKENFENGIYKSLYLKNNLAILIYFNSESDFVVEIFGLTKCNILIKKVIYIEVFPGEIALNDFIKINDERFVFITANNGNINLILIDFYNNYSNIKIRAYKLYSLDYHFYNELSAILYNDYLILTITASHESDKAHIDYN